MEAKTINSCIKVAYLKDGHAAIQGFSINNLIFQARYSVSQSCPILFVFFLPSSLFHLPSIFYPSPPILSPLTSLRKRVLFRLISSRFSSVRS